MHDRKVEIFGAEYEIKFVEKFPERYSEYEDNADGLFNPYNKEILIHMRNEDKELTPAGIMVRLKKTLRHEIIHAALFESGISSNGVNYCASWSENEEMVDWFAIQSQKIFKVFQELDIL